MKLTIDHLYQLNDIRREDRGAPVFHRPHLLELEGENWVIATNSWIALGLRVNAFEDPTLTDDLPWLNSENERSTMSSLLGIDIARGKEIQIDELRDWAQHSHSVYPAMICGVSIDKGLLAGLLHQLPGPTVHVGPGKLTIDYLWLANESWRAVIASYRLESNHSLDRFEGRSV
jgi:hypothetical protein